MTKEWTWPMVQAEVRRLDRNVKGDTFTLGALLLASTLVGANRRALRRFTSLPAETIDRYAQRFETTGVWKRGRVVVSDWFEKGTGGIAFWLDVAVAEGLLERVDAPVGEGTEQPRAAPPEILKESHD